MFNPIPKTRSRIFFREFFRAIQTAGQTVDIRASRARIFKTLFMTIQQAEAILLQTGVKIALQHRFAWDTGTLLRLDNYAMINIFDDGRYFIQGEDTVALIAAFGQIEQPWDPEAWSGDMPRQAMPVMFAAAKPAKGIA